MARDDFINNLRMASSELGPMTVESDQGPELNAYYSRMLRSADLWLTYKSVEGFGLADFPELQQKQRQQLVDEVNAFLAIAKEVPADKPASKEQSDDARTHLLRIIEIVGGVLRTEWLSAQQHVIKEASDAAEAHGWYVKLDQKTLIENLLGKYKAPRLLITTENNRQILLDPIARFGSGRQGIVNLVVMPSFDTRYMLTFKDNGWSIISRSGSHHRRPFNQMTLVNSISAVCED